MAFEKRYTAKQAAEAVIEKTKELLAKSELHKKYEGFKAVEESARESGAHDPAAVAAAAGRKKYGKHAFQEAAAHGHKMGKAESKHDRCAEHVKENSPEVRNPHAVCVAEGVKPASWSKSEDVNSLCEGHSIGAGYGIAKSEMDKCHSCGMHKHGMSPEQMKAKLVKHGLSPNQVEARMKKHELVLAKYESENSKELGYKLPEAGRHESEPEKTDKDYEVHGDKPANALGPKSPASDNKIPEVQKSEQDRLRTQTNPMKNPKEQAEGNNELAGTTPTQVGQDGKNIMGYDEMKGHLKLAKFIGRMEHKRTMKLPGANNG